MGTQATGTFEIAKWDEKPYDEVDGQAKLTHATITGAFKGDFEGEGAAAYLMAYREDESACYVFLHRVVGRLGGRSGGFVLEGSGVYENGVARGDWAVVPGSGTGELSGLRGRGGFRAPEGMTMHITLDYEIA